jgi:hypothetical protein
MSLHSQNKNKNKNKTTSSVTIYPQKHKEEVKWKRWFTYSRAEEGLSFCSYKETRTATPTKQYYT